MRFTAEMMDTLKSYVYVYTDPRGNEPFYIGRGQGNRAFAHLDETGETLKVARIREIHKFGAKPQIDIQRYGLTDEQAPLVEAAVIDLLGCPPLTNARRVDHSRSFGRISSKELITMMNAEPAEIAHKAILITINAAFGAPVDYGMLIKSYAAPEGRLELVGRNHGLSQAGPTPGSARESIR